MRLIRTETNKTNLSPNCQFFLNLDLDSQTKPNLAHVVEARGNFFVFSVFSSSHYIETLLESHSNLSVFTVFPLFTQNNDSKISALLGLKEADWTILESSLSFKFDKHSKKLM